MPLRWATWGTYCGWGGYGADYIPVYYDYGDTVIYEGDYVYLDGEVVGTAEEYADQAYALAETGATAISEAEANEAAGDIEWLPLGVYALSPEGATEPTQFLQLAVTKDGVIGGTYYDSKTDKTTTVEGAIDRETQRAAFTIEGMDGVVMEAGIANLTQDESTILIHRGGGQKDIWTLVRIENPEEEATSP